MNPMPPQDRPPCASKGDIMFGPHLVALMDFVGQSQKLMEWDYCPDKHTLPHFLDSAKSTFGTILIWREQFERNFREFVESRIDTIAEAAEQLPDKGARVRRFQAAELGFSHFSDSIVVYFPVISQHGVENVANVTGAVVICGVLLLAALANRKSVFRGGIDIGMAARFPQADLYGPALAKVHRLESRFAQYPRILVGEQLRAYLTKHDQSQGTAPEDHANRASARMSLPLLTQDHDGQWMVDYLGQGFVDATRKPDQLKNLYNPAWDFVRDERDRFRREQDECLAERYGKLASYFESRLAGARSPTERPR